MELIETGIFNRQVRCDQANSNTAAIEMLLRDRHNRHSRKPIGNAGSVQRQRPDFVQRIKSVSPDLLLARTAKVHNESRKNPSKVSKPFSGYQIYALLLPDLDATRRALQPNIYAGGASTDSCPDACNDSTCESTKEDAKASSRGYFYERVAEKHVES